MIGHATLKQESLVIFQHTEHFDPFALVVSMLILEFSLYTTSDLDVMHSSEKSTSFVISNNFLSKLIFKLAYKLDPITLLALFSSILILQTFLILISSNHF